ncbi:MAG: CoA ester lyase [Moraxella sp.]|nr:CoA ester lyase [Moraxella sp.]
MYQDHFSTYLFVPATRLDRAVKAAGSGASHIIIDLEDAVEPEHKAQVRDDLLAFDRQSDIPYWLRINAAHTCDYTHDVKLLNELTHAQGVLLPKTESALSVTALHQATSLPIIAVIETAKGVLNIPQIATAAGLFAMTYGCLDLGKSLGVLADTPSAKVVFDRIRTDLLLHSVANGLSAPIETIFADFQDDSGVGEFAKYAQAFGFGGQLLIHPRQVPPVQRATTPSDEVLNFARQVLAVHDETGRAVFSVQGKMVDLPVINWAKNLLARS